MTISTCVWFKAYNVSHLLFYTYKLLSMNLVIIEKKYSIRNPHESISARNDKLIKMNVVKRCE